MTRLNQKQEYLLKELLKDFKGSAEDLLGEEGLIKQVTKRALEVVYPIVYFDCLFVKSRQSGMVSNQAVYLALGINMEGKKEVLGMWINESEGSKFWLVVFNELKSRGMEDCFIACVDGLQGLPEAIEAVYPQTRVQMSWHENSK